MPIASNFRDIMAFTVAATDKAFAEPLQIVPMIAGRYTTEPRPDPDRTARNVIGIYLEVSAKKQMLDQAPGMGRTFGSELDVSDPTVSVLTTAFYVDGALVLPQKGDYIVRTELASEPKLEITSVDTDGALRTLMQVVKVSA
jgi:hypothetical protein